jgi:hypothetical protein
LQRHPALHDLGYYAAAGGHMRRFTNGVALTVVLMVGACGSAPSEKTPPPDSAPVPGDPAQLKTLKAQQQTAPSDAVTGLEAYVSKYPTDPKGHWQLSAAILATVPTLARKYTDADRAAVERAAQHARQVTELSGDQSLRTAAFMRLTTIYGPMMLARPEAVLEPAKQLIAMSATLADPHFLLAEALADLKRIDEAVQVWPDALNTLRGRDRRQIAVGINGFADRYPLTEAHIRTLVTVLRTVAEDVENPDPRAHAVLLTLQANRLEKDPATRRALLQQAAPLDRPCRPTE